MWVANHGQQSFMESKASFLLSKLKEWEKHGKDTLVSFIFDDFCEMVRMGHSIALDEVRSTPWEFAIDVVIEANMDAMAADGWEFVSICGSENGQVIWKRRKAVRELEEVGDVEVG